LRGADDDDDDDDDEHHHQDLRHPFFVFRILVIIIGRNRKV
jgi:hypothetical protein